MSQYRGSFKKETVNIIGARSIMSNFRRLYIDKELDVYDTIPNDGIEVDSHGFIKNNKDWKVLAEYPERLNNKYYFCKQCTGYIMGEPEQEREDTIGPLAGRCGTSYRCKRCGYELGFNGYMS